MSATLSFEINVRDSAKGVVPIRTLTREFDVNAWQVFPQAETDVIAFGREANALLLFEAVKKKKRLWWPHLWRKIQRWLRTGSDQSASAA